jgi:hypothetical protein
LAEETMDKQVQQEIKNILDHLSDREDGALPFSDENEQGTEVIDVFVVRRQTKEAELPTVEGTVRHTFVDPDAEAVIIEQEIEEREATEPTPPPLAHKARRHVLPLVVGALCLLLALAGGLLTLLLILAPSATVTIIPASTQITTSRTVIVVPANANAAEQEVPGRALPTITLSQARTAPATGAGHQQAQAARGLLTFYNALLTPQTIPAGELLTGADGVAVVTLQDAVIPAGTLATNGQVTVPAQATNAGPQGNIHAGDIYGTCCRDDVFAVNGPFSGGKNARSYQMVTQQDITAVVSSLKTSLNQSAQAALSQQVQPSETLVTPVLCTFIVMPDHKAGEEAGSVQVTVSETCTGEVYDTGALHDLLMQAVTQQAAKQIGKGYGLVGDLQTSITGATMNTRQGMATLRVNITSTWMYRFSLAQQDQIKLAIRGKNKATALLLHMPEVQSASISTSDGNALPMAVGRIHLNFVILA